MERRSIAERGATRNNKRTGLWGFGVVGVFCGEGREVVVFSSYLSFSPLRILVRSGTGAEGRKKERLMSASLKE